MPEGDTLFRTAAGLRPHLVGKTITSARARQPGPQAERLVGSTVQSVEAVGKNLLVRFDNGLEVRTHLRMNGSWHRYRPGERWRRPASRARLVLEVPGTVAVCFDAPVVELFESRAEEIHPAVRGLGPDLLSPEFDPAEATRRLRAPDRATHPIAEALVDQRALAGIGNIWKSETLFAERIWPFTPVGDLPEEALEGLGTKCLGVVLNNIDLKYDNTYQYCTSYNPYYSKSKPKAKPAKSAPVNRAKETRPEAKPSIDDAEPEKSSWARTLVEELPAEPIGKDAY